MKKKTHSEFIEEVKLAYPDNSITINGIYVRNNEPIRVTCNICNYSWNPTPSSLTRGITSCKKCRAAKRTRDSSWYLKKLESKGLNIVPLEEYRGATTPINHRCNVCNSEFKTPPTYHIQGHGCKKCAINLRAKLYSSNINEYNEKLNDKFNGTIYAVGIYTNNKTKVTHVCSICNHKWKSRPDMMLYGNSSCPVCEMSEGERQIYNILISNKVKFERQKSFPDCRYIKPLPFDFAIYDHNNIVALIEFDGEQHFKPKECFGGEKEYLKTLKRDSIKTEYCVVNNIKLIRIPYYEKHNINHLLSDIVESYGSKLGG